MKQINARVHMGGNQFRTIPITLYSTAEAKTILSEKEWELDDDVFDTNGKSIGWLAKFPDGDGIYIERKRGI